MAKTIILIKPYRGGWEVFEAPGVQPYFGGRKHAVNYAMERAKMRKGEIRILDTDGEVLEKFPFDDSRRFPTLSPGPENESCSCSRWCS